MFFPGVYPDLTVPTSSGRGYFLVVLASLFMIFNLALIGYDLIVNWALPVARRRENIIAFRVKARHATPLINRRNRAMAKRLAKLLAEERRDKKDKSHSKTLSQKKSKFSARVREEEDNGTLVKVDGGFHSV